MAVAELGAEGEIGRLLPADNFLPGRLAPASGRLSIASIGFGASSSLKVELLAASRREESPQNRPGDTPKTFVASRQFKLKT